MDGELFLAWVKQGLVPGLQRDDVVILDNLWSMTTILALPPGARLCRRD